MGGGYGLSGCSVEETGCIDRVVLSLYMQKMVSKVEKKSIGLVIRRVTCSSYPTEAYG